MAGARSNQNLLTTAATSTPRRLDSAIHQKDRQDRFLAAFTVCGSIVQACRAARINRQTHYYWLSEDPTYPARFQEARQRAAQALEDEATRRAREGVRRPRLFNGKPIFINGEMQYEVQYSDRLLELLLKANDRARFDPPKETINLLELEVELLSAAQLDKLLEHLIVKMAGPDPEAQAAARRDLAAGPTPMGTPASRVREAGERLQDLLLRFEAVMISGPSTNDLMAIISEIRVVTDMFAAPATAIEAKSEDL